ncbi:hypothetical protein CLG96_05315 [Sphingomonas oleivorans]|uniref:CBS domain-containing protein n=1 Tax=Sphingomonas oleivorans TaxID=1735121 RepID=A0A2T5G3A5_9SPHN|nr:CBS domain-containing protein [Sphingomonas oleivorans]PTQ13624.1 hypothetical protein CLG96_05315 [Sphingomonas oleivorans]
MTIGAIVERRRKDDIVTVGRETAVRDVVALLARRRIGAVPVMDGGRVIGIMSERDVIYGLQRDGAALLDRPVEQVMTAPAIAAPREMSLFSALALMTERRIRHLPVVEDGRMVGFVSIGDIVKMRIDRIEQEADAMRDYIQSS